AGDAGEPAVEPELEPCLGESMRSERGRPRDRRLHRGRVRVGSPAGETQPGIEAITPGELSPEPVLGYGIEDCLAIQGHDAARYPEPAVGLGNAVPEAHPHRAGVEQTVRWTLGGNARGKHRVRPSWTQTSAVGADDGSGAIAQQAPGPARCIGAGDDSGREPVE